jgi:oxygen-independent coproporphyrinogen-3 oxidase
MTLRHSPCARAVIHRIGKQQGAAYFALCRVPHWPAARQWTRTLMTRTPAPTARFLPALALETVPRYTSYPPATRFHGGVTSADWSGWMSDLPENPRVSLYLHIPFCRSMCWYCGCNTTIPNKDDRVARYLEVLHAEIDLRANDLPAGAVVNHIHFGGGSPDMLSPERFAAIMERLRASYSIAADAEIAVELDPRGITPELADAMAANGVTRASLGVQDLSDEVQVLIHRVQPESVVRAAVDTLRQAGINAINMDVMYGLPAQTVERVEATSRIVAAMKPDRVAVFGYAHVPWFKKHQKAIPEDRLPGAQERFEQMLAAGAVFSAAGFGAVGFDHFARPGDPLAQACASGQLSRNFQGYTDDDYDVLIGLGASAISDTGAGFVQNEPDPVHYATRMTDRRSAIVRGVSRSAEDHVISDRIERLMCRFELDLPAADLPEASERLADLEALELVKIDATGLRVTQAGRPYVRNIAARLDPAFTPSTGQHSQAV